MRNFIFILMLALIAAMPMSGAARAADEPITITIKDHRFQPAEVKVPANTRIILNVVNDDATPEEFESKPMKVEKVIAGKSKALIRIGPLQPGRYPFVGEYHEATAKGVVIAE
jgi:plastocyanin